MEQLHALPAHIVEFSKTLTDELQATMAALEKIRQSAGMAAAELDTISDGIAAALDIAEVIAELARHARAAVEHTCTGD